MIINDIEQTRLRLFIEGSWVEPSSGRIDRAMRFAATSRSARCGSIPTAPPPSRPPPGFNASGYGKHNGFEVIPEYSRLKSVLIDYSGVTQDAFIMRVN